MIIGLTGKNAAGKGELAEVLKESGFQYYSLSDVLREELQERSREVSRENLIQIGTELRTRYGPAVLADRILRKLEIDKNYVVDSFRHPREVDAFRARKHFHLIHVSASQQIRFERIVARKRESDPATLEQFFALEAKEANHPDPYGQQLDATAELADVEVANDRTIDEFRLQAKKIIRDLAAGETRPSWDEYFMEIAKVVALRSNCIKRKVAAVIVKNERIISTGYNGTPRGVTNCKEGGCPRCNQFVASGTNLDECFCSHAEENAITQAAYHGVNIKGGTLYTTFSPCLICTKMILNSGIVEVVYSHHYPLGTVALKLLSEAGIRLRRL